MPARRLNSYESQQFAARRRNRLVWIAVLSVISVVCWIFILSRLSAIPFFSIQDIQITGADRDIIPVIYSAAKDSIQGDYMGLFSKANILIYPRRAIEKSVKNTSARIGSVFVKRSGLHSLLITVDERKPAAVVCANLPDFEDNTLVFGSVDDCYLADADGLIFEEATSSSLGDLATYNRYYIPDLNETPIGLHATSTERFSAMQGFYAGVRRAGISPRGILLKGDGEYELYAENPVVIIYFNDRGILGRELDNLVSFWTRMKSDSRSKGETMRLDSIDLRYGSNIFYQSMK